MKGRLVRRWMCFQRGYFDTKEIHVELIAGQVPVTEGHWRPKCQVVLALQPVTVGLHELSLCLPANFILLIFHESFPISVG